MSRCLSLFVCDWFPFIHLFLRNPCLISLAILVKHSPVISLARRLNSSFARTERRPRTSTTHSLSQTLCSLVYRCCLCQWFSTYTPSIPSLRILGVVDDNNNNNTECLRVGVAGSDKCKEGRWFINRYVFTLFLADHSLPTHTPLTDHILNISDP